MQKFSNDHANKHEVCSLKNSSFFEFRGPKRPKSGLQDALRTIKDPVNHSRLSKLFLS